MIKSLTKKFKDSKYKNLRDDVLDLLEEGKINHDEFKKFMDILKKLKEAKKK